VRKILCFIFGHKFVVITQITTSQSQFGHIRCSRCGYEEQYQYDFVNPLYEEKRNEMQ
jgi:predicted nucleic-acid-binding Zn-ribbon protein